MVAVSKTGGLRLLASIGAGLVAALLCRPAISQMPMSLEEVARRMPPNFTPLHASQEVIIRGVVSARPFHFPDHTLLALEEARQGTILYVPGTGREIESYQSGQELEITGTVSSDAGMVVVLPKKIRNLGRRQPPAPGEVPVEELVGFRHLGKLVRTEGRINEIGETTAGPFVQVATRKGGYRIFFPHGPGLPGTSLADFKIGDKIAATGVANQYCTTPPYNRWFELLVADPSQLVRIERSWLISPLAVAGALLTVLLIALLLWIRERRLTAQRERLRKSYQLGEAILGASSPEEILAEVAAAVSKVLGVTSVHLYIYNRGAKALDLVGEAVGEAAVGEANAESALRDHAGPATISLASPPSGTQAGAVACFHYRTLLAIPDLSRSPFPISAGPGQNPPKSLLFVPMLSQGDVVGVLELDQDDRSRDFSPDEQALAQHLGNQIGVAIRLLDQRSVQEQLFRTEKLAAVGRLISSVVNELKSPLVSIEELASRAILKSTERDMTAIAAEARKASAIVSRLVSFATAEQGEAQPVCISKLLRSLIEFREQDWKASGIRVRDLVSSDSFYVLGSHGQLEQAFLTLFVHAEQSLADAAEKSLSIRTSLLAKRLLVEIGFGAPTDARPPQETAMALGVTRSVLAGHGGEVRLVQKDHSELRIEVELPLLMRERSALASSSAPAAAMRNGNRQATALVIEPDDQVQHQLLTLLSARAYRVVPVDNADAGLELAQRMRFEVAFCSAHAPGLNWVELSERLQSRAGGFILLSDRYDPELLADFAGEGRFVIVKPVQESELEHVLESLDAAASVSDSVKETAPFGH